MSAPRITFIINPIAGGRSKSRFKYKLNRIFANAGYEVISLYTRYPSHAFEYARMEVEAGTKIVVAVGGDGTINEVARALLHSKTALGIIPYGSGNGFARHFGFPLSINKALKILLRENIRPVDVGYVNSEPFFCTSGVGFDAETGYYFSNFEKRGFISYALSFMRVFRDYIPKLYEIEINGISRTFEAFFINIANISQFGFHFFISPGASAEDGYFDMVIVKRFPKWKGVFLAMRSFAGTIHNSKYGIVEKAHDIRLLKPPDQKVIHIDGDPVTTEGILHYRLEQNALNVILPVEKRK